MHRTVQYSTRFIVEDSLQKSKFKQQRFNARQGKARQCDVGVGVYFPPFFVFFFPPSLHLQVAVENECVNVHVVVNSILMEQKIFGASTHGKSYGRSKRHWITLTNAKPRKKSISFHLAFFFPPPLRFTNQRSLSL